MTISQPPIQPAAVAGLRMPGQSKALLRALAAAHPETLSVMTLALVLWPDSKPRTAFRSLQGAIHRLRCDMLGCRVPAVVPPAQAGRYRLERVAGGEA